MTTLVSWGGNQHGQLGVGALEQNKVVEPIQLDSLRDVDIADISCGDCHTLFMLHDGSVYSCGNNDYGQLGHDKRRSRPEKITCLEHLTVHQICGGMSHNLCLTEAWEMFSWGDNNQGQLGRGQLTPELCRIPKLIKFPHNVVQICCGRNHCMSLTDDGRLFSWGENKFGQLGLGSTTSHNTPQMISCVQGIPIAQIACGGSHSFILSHSSAVFGWGRNCFGQLGVNDERDRIHPTLCKSLRTQKISYITCGEDHSAALTQDGGLFTFGAGTFGQLGHGSKTNEIHPRKVQELMGSTVTQVACGRRHSLAYVENNGRLYVFGSGANGQLSDKDPSIRATPVQVKGAFTGVQSYPNAMDTGEAVMRLKVKRIAAGADQCVVWTTSNETSSPADYRVLDSRFTIKTLTPGWLEDVGKVRANDAVPVELDEDLSKIFSSSSCINASFLLQNTEHFSCSSKKHGVDMEGVRNNLYTKLEIAKSEITRKICSCIESRLLPSLPKSPPDVEALRLYLILPELPVFEQPQYCASLVYPFGKSILSLDKPASRVLDLWWGSLPAKHFLRITSIYKECVTHSFQLSEPKSVKQMEIKYQSIYVALEILLKLNTVNEQNGQIIPYNKFYITDLKDKVDLQKDYIKWVQQQNAKFTPGEQLLFCNYPFTFDAPAKSSLLNIDARMQMQSAIDEVHRRNIQSLFLPIDPVNPMLVFYVSRENIVQDTIRQLTQQGSADLKKPLKIIFMGEEADDAGGVRKEFFLLLLRELLDPKYGMFMTHEESRMEWFSPFSFEDQQMYLLIGCLCGLAIYNTIIINLNFPLVLFKKLLSRQPNLDDLKELMPTVGRSLQQLLQYDGDDVEDTFCLTFEMSQDCFGETRTKELVPGGSSKHVTKENRQEYVDLYVDNVFNQSVSEPFGAFNTGFHKVCGGRVLELFHPQELRAMVVGNENYDFHELEKNTIYKGEFHRYHETLTHFWDVFHDLPLQEKKKFLLFLTGSDKIPISGMSSVKLIIQPVSAPESYLPVAHTCFNLLDLPMYSKKAVLKEKLLQAIQQTEGFGLV